MEDGNKNFVDAYNDFSALMSQNSGMSTRKKVLLAEALDSSNQDETTTNEYKTFHHGLNYTDIAELTQWSSVTIKKKLEALIDLPNDHPHKIHDEEFKKLGRGWTFTRTAVYKFFDFYQILMSHSMLNPGRKAEIINVENHKGGVGKTIIASHIAVNLALKISKRYKILLIDLDPQGSLRHFFNSDLAQKSDSDEIFSAADIMLEYGFDAYKDMAESEAELLEYRRDFIFSNAIQDTYLTNLKTIVAFPEDIEYNAKAWSRTLVGDMTPATDLYERVIKPVENDFDFIIIDTGPHQDPLAWTALWAQTALIIPCTPKPLDMHSTSNFIESLPKFFKNAPVKTRPEKMSKLVFTLVDGTNPKHSDYRTKTNMNLGSKYSFMPFIPEARCFENASKQSSTIYELPTAKSQTYVNICKASLDHIVSDIEYICLNDIKNN